MSKKSLTSAASSGVSWAYIFLRGACVERCDHVSVLDCCLFLLPSWRLCDKKYAKTKKVQVENNLSAAFLEPGIRDRRGTSRGISDLEFWIIFDFWWRAKFGIVRSWMRSEVASYIVLNNRALIRDDRVTDYALQRHSVTTEMQKLSRASIT